MWRRALAKVCAICYRCGVTYVEALRTLFARANAGFKLGLAPMRLLLTALGNPESKLACVLVAGTNGKGSTCTFLAHALQAQGKQVGLYTSPHLLRFTERIRIDGDELAQGSVATLYDKIVAAETRAGLELSFFEITTAMALLAFRAHDVQTAVLEVGLGGRLDATNAVPRILSVITPIDLDHQEYLGDSLAAIAREKADIIAPGVPVVVGPQHQEAMTVIAQVARERGAPVIDAEPMAYPPQGQPPYQAINLGIGMAAAKALGCSQEAIDSALASFAWPGRYQWLGGVPPILVDGAHNPASLRAVFDAVRADLRCAGRPIHAVFSALRTKEAEAMLVILKRACRSVHLCPVSSQRSRTLEELQHLGGGKIPVHASVAEALAAAQNTAQPEDLILATGSLFLAADVLAGVLNLPRDPPVDG